MAGLNKISLIGHLGRDPELREYQGNKVATFSLAVSEKYTDREGKLIEKTEWFSVSFWGNIADIPMKFLKKGSQVYVDGKLSSREYLDKEGKTRFALEVKGQNITLLGGAPEGQQSASQSTNTNPQKQVSEPLPSEMTPAENGDDLPF
ncbi:MAG: single-stranded DNA-binding protein [Cytophagia bacterium]|nr:MAG: single-stranded DNA-binding protein [Cytophagales bacterium]TAG05286.1 MAG: single-stranded DNA-binding protein [Cytophagia bacterium]TAG42503.1 MAG: single-stranded DNA-binding protein [Cytophagia bacterium]TAH28703.1 MAG: single-stranded DNA-binding protein [Cytophagales bacterium]